MSFELMQIALNLVRFDPKLLIPNSKLGFSPNFLPPG
jgi:hypothetical protein